MTNADIAQGLVKGGVFRGTWMAELGYDRSAIGEIVSATFGDALAEFSNGWFGVMSNETVAAFNLMRVAGAIDGVAVPFCDISEMIIKMIRYGRMGKSAKRDKVLGETLAEMFSTAIPRDVLQALCMFVGADCTGGCADFSSCEYVIMPINHMEYDVLGMLGTRRNGNAPTCWLSRRLATRPSRTSVDYTILPSIPFVLKSANGPARLLGRIVTEEDMAKDSGETFIALTRSPCGRRISLEYRLNEEAVEGNSFNVRPEWRDLVHGEFREVNTGGRIKYNREGRDARKFIGLGVAIRKAYPNYENGESAVIVIDHGTGLSSIEVGNRYSERFEARIASLMADGITPRGIPSPLAA
jgi:hypothetical protein